MGFGDRREEAGCSPGPWAAAMTHPHGGKYEVEMVLMVQPAVQLKKLSTGRDTGQG